MATPASFTYETAFFSGLLGEDAGRSQIMPQKRFRLEGIIAKPREGERANGVSILSETTRGLARRVRQV